MNYAYPGITIFLYLLVDYHLSVDINNNAINFIYSTIYTKTT